jgi:hypothetical protein
MPTQTHADLRFELVTCPFVIIVKKSDPFPPAVEPAELCRWVQRLCTYVNCIEMRVYGRHAHAGVANKARMFDWMRQAQVSNGVFMVARALLLPLLVALMLQMISVKILRLGTHVSRIKSAHQPKS